MYGYFVSPVKVFASVLVAKTFFVDFNKKGLGMFFGGLRLPKKQPCPNY